MSLHVRDAVRDNVRYPECFAYYLRLAFDAGREETDFTGTIVVNGRAENHRVNRVAICDCVFKATQHHGAGAAGKYGAARRSVKGSAVTITGQDFTFAVQVAMAVRKFDGDSAGERHVALLIEERLTGEVNCDERRRAGGLNVDARTAKV